MTIIERYMSSQKGHGGICAFELKCAGVVWLILAAVFLTYWSSFFLGNHDFRFMRYGVPLEAGVFEGRFTQFLPSWLLTGGHILPAFNVLLGFAFFALAAVRLAEWYGLSERYRDVLPFTFADCVKSICADAIILCAPDTVHIRLAFSVRLGRDLD